MTQETEQGRYSASKSMYAALMDILPDWDEWIVSPRTRLGLVTEGLERSEYEDGSHFYRHLRQNADYTGSSSAAAVSLWSKLKDFQAGPIDGFFNEFMGVFEERLRSSDDANSQKLLYKVEQLKEE